LLGKRGTALGPDRIIEVHVRKRVERFLKANRAFQSVLRLFYTTVYEPLLKFTAGLIDEWVPADTGQLRFSMASSMTAAGGSKVRNMVSGNKFRVVLGTPGIAYASLVDRMPEPWMIHPAPYHRNKSAMTGRALHDPGAREGWYGLILANARREAQHLWSRFVRKSGLSNNDFVVRFR
jgi:hypothetical protein